MVICYGSKSKHGMTKTSLSRILSQKTAPGCALAKKGSKLKKKVEARARTESSTEESGEGQALVTAGQHTGRVWCNWSTGSEGALQESNEQGRLTRLQCRARMTGHIIWLPHAQDTDTPKAQGTSKAGEGQLKRSCPTQSPRYQTRRKTQESRGHLASGGHHKS